MHTYQNDNNLMIHYDMPMVWNVRGGKCILFYYFGIL
jgi:hypothetical protein